MPLLDFLASSPLAFVLSVLVLGLLIGSFLNVVIYRLPKMLERDWKIQAREVLALPAEPVGETFNLMLPHSRCPHCAHKIRAWENLPVISYLFLAGKCSSCEAPISKRYPLVELACGLLSAYIAWHFGFGWQAAAMLVLSWGLLAMSMIDADHQLLPDALVLPLLWLGLIVNTFGLFTSLHDALWGAVAGYLSLWSVFWLFKLVTGKEGMGFGDFKLFAALGAWFGWQALVPIILMASIIGAVVGIAMKFSSALRAGGYVPFGPFLAGAGLTAMIFGPGSILRIFGL